MKVIITENIDMHLVVEPSVFEYIMAWAFGKSVTNVFEQKTTGDIWINRCKLWKTYYYLMEQEIIKFEKGER